MGKRIGIGAIMRKISEKETPPDKVSVVSKINNYCSSGIDSGSFSVIRIKAKLKYLMDLVEDEFDRAKFFSEFHSLYSMIMAPDKRAKGVFHPSQLLEGCLRCMVYELSGIKPTDVSSAPIKPELQRIFDVGTWYHIYFQQILYNLGLLEQAEVPVINPDKFINGKADGVFKESVFGEKVVLEIKTMNSFMYSRAIFKPFKKHEFQASLYARELGAKKVLYLYINKDSSEIREFLEPISYDQLAIADKKMENGIVHLKGKTLPSRSCSDKFCDTAVNCIFRSLCFE